jgi:predicted  nucleic acid-binding Zn-ribbon protein
MSSSKAAVVREELEAVAPKSPRSSEQHPSVEDVLVEFKRCRERLLALAQELEQSHAPLRALETDVATLLDHTERHAREIESAPPESQALRSAKEAWKRSMGRITKVTKDEEEQLRAQKERLRGAVQAVQATEALLDAALVGLLEFRAGVKAFEKSQREPDEPKKRKRSERSPERSPRASAAAEDGRRQRR